MQGSRRIFTPFWTVRCSVGPEEHEGFLKNNLLTTLLDPAIQVSTRILLDPVLIDYKERGVCGGD